MGIRACYDEGKRCAETLFYDYRRQHNLDIRVARIFNTYGPKMHPQDGRVISNFIIQALKNEPITIYGDGSQTRSFCFVDDLIRRLVRLMNVSVSCRTRSISAIRRDHHQAGCRGNHCADRFTLPARASCRCPRTIRGSAALTFRGHGSCSTGSRASR